MRTACSRTAPASSRGTGAGRQARAYFCLSAYRAAADSARCTSALSGVGALRGRQISTRPLKDVMKPERLSSYKDPNLSRLEYQPI